MMAPPLEPWPSPGKPPHDPRCSHVLCIHKDFGNNCHATFLISVFTAGADLFEWSPLDEWIRLVPATDVRMWLEIFYMYRNTL